MNKPQRVFDGTILNLKRAFPSPKQIALDLLPGPSRLIIPAQEELRKKILKEVNKNSGGYAQIVEREGERLLFVFSKRAHIPDTGGVDGSQIILGEILPEWDIPGHSAVGSVEAFGPGQHEYGVYERVGTMAELGFRGPANCD